MGRRIGRDRSKMKSGDERTLKVNLEEKGMGESIKADGLAKWEIGIPEAEEIATTNVKKRTAKPTIISITIAMNVNMTIGMRTAVLASIASASIVVTILLAPCPLLKT